MINMGVAFPTQTIPADANFPFGGAQNVAAPGDGIGTPWERTFLNDHFGLYAALMEAAGLTPSGVSETALVSQLFDAMRISVSAYKNVKAFGAVGDGVADDTVKIQDALDSVATDGGGIFFPPGTYLTNNLDVSGNVTVLGIGGDLKLKDGSNSPLITVLAGAENARILNLKMDGNHANNLATVATDGLIKLASTTVSPIKDLWIKDCMILDSYQAAIILGDDAERIHILDNFIEGIPIGSGGANVGSGILVSPLASGFTTRIHIRGNEITGFVGSSIRGGIVEDIQIVDNKIYHIGIGTDAIELSDENNDVMMIADNIISSSGNHGINAGGDGIVISDNVIEDWTDHGITVDATGTANAQSPGCVVTGNHLFNPKINADGIQVKNAPGCVVSNNRVEGGASADNGIRIVNTGLVDTMDRFLCNGNMIQNFLIASLLVQGGAGIKAGSVSGNVIGGTGSVGTGISITNTNQTVFSNNEVNSHSIGLSESASSDYNNCSINSFRGNTTPIIVTGVNTLSVSNIV